MDEQVLSAGRVRQHGSFQLDLPAAEAFKLFTAAGERLWVPGWSPTILGALPQHCGLVFTTGDGAERSIWTVIESEAASGRVRYSRVTPGSRAGIVTVEVAAIASGSQVDVAYDLTALSAEGETALKAYSSTSFAQMIEDWRGLIVAALVTERDALSTLVV
ncbi:hypothetical protein AB2M62_02240 [Sphingomonas sp. MMS12-HWE2-04]|uniref:hypothetical protein n=1 Tax=Sphingomonas sp. MMS12-HWE2-04 TaxID=3234199 RepID=UPI00384CD3D9